MFQPRHFLWMGLCAAFIAGMLVVSAKKKWSARTAGYVMSGIAIASEISKIMSDMLESAGGGRHLDPRSLPFHLCSLLLFAVLYIAFGPEGKVRRLLINFTAVMGTLGSLCAILIPTNGTNFARIPAYQCFVYHAGLMWFSLYLLLSKEARPGEAKNWGKNLLLLVALTFAVLYVNGALSAYDTNFFYLTRPPMDGLPYLNLDQGWYVYFLRLTALGAALISLFHLPFILKERQKRRAGA